MTGRTLTLDLSLPPSVNAIFANVAGKGRVRTAAYRQWQREALATIQVQARGATFRGTFRLAVLASDEGLTRRRDADNLGKAIADALTKAGVIADDSWHHMRAIVLAWASKLPAGTCRVHVIELQQAGSHVSKVPATPLPGQKNVAPAPLKSRQNARAKAKPATVPASILAALTRRGINVSPERVHL